MKYMGIILLVLMAFSAANAATFNVTNAGNFASAGYSVINLQQVPDRIYPGDQARLKFDLQNIKTSEVKDITVTVAIPFLDYKQNFLINSLASKESDSIAVDFNVPISTKPGDYVALVYAIDQLDVQAQVGEIPIIIYEQSGSNSIIASLDSPIEMYAGDTINANFNVENIGKFPVEDVNIRIQYVSTSSILPVGTDRIHIPSIKEGESEKVKFQLGINSGISPGYYPITIIIDYKVDKIEQDPITQTIGMKAVARTKLQLTTEQSQSTTDGTESITITIANTGDTAVRGVYAKATSDDYRFTGTSERFIGTLNLDDTATMTLSPIARGMNNQSRKINVRVTFKDSLNIEHTETTTIDMMQGAGGLGIGSGFIPGAIGNQRFGRQTQQQGFRIFGFDPLMIGIGIVLLLLAFFGYKWVKRRGK